MESEEPMDVDAGEFEKLDDLLEEGECVESHRVSRKSLSSVISLQENRIESKAGNFVTGVDIFGKEAQEKLEERAKRFGMKKDAERSIIKEAENLYESFGIVEGTLEAREYRLNVLHMRGTENMNTKDVFKYFEDYAPASIEWINDISCNVVWLDKVSAARAIIGLSKKIVGIKNSKKKVYSDDESEEDSDDDVIINGSRYVKEENSIHVKDIRCPLPSGIWRKGRDYKDSRSIFLRFATILDRKLHPAEKKGLKGILTNSRKRSLRQIKEPSPPTSQNSTNGIAAKNPWGSLSKNWGVTDIIEDDYLPVRIPVEPAGNVRERLGFKSQDRDDFIEEESTVIELSDDSQVSESSSDEENWCRRSKMPRMRMHADDEEEKIQKRKGKIRNLVNHRAMVIENDLRVTDDLRRPNDLRGRLTAKRRLPPKSLQPVYKEDIQVVLTNPKLRGGVLRGDFKDIDVTEDEYEDEDDRPIKIPHQIIDDDEEEEGEIIDDSDSDSKVEYEDDEEEEELEIEEDEEEEEENVYETTENIEDETESDTESTSSSVSEKEIQGPKGSVIKVVPRKPKLQSTVSTVWSRLNNSKKDRRDDSSPERNRSKTDLRHTLKKNDLRSRIGNHHMRGRSPLRIELRNDKYAGKRSESD